MQGKGIDASINKKGQAQAQAFYEAYKNVNFDIVYTSTLKRTAESVASFIQAGITHVTHAGLDEISWGVYEGVEANYEEKAFFKSLTDKWGKGETSLAIKHGESPDEVARRLRAVTKLLTRGSESTILICMHGRALRIFLTELLHVPLAEMDRFTHANLGLYELSYISGKFGLEKENDVQHLNNL